MDHLAVFWISFTVALSGALMPGPLLTAVIAESARQGFRSGPCICIGHALLEALMVCLLIAGIWQVAELKAVMRAVSLGGSAILLYFGLSMIAGAGRLSLSGASGGSRPRNPVLLGVTVSLSNPYWTMWWLTAGAGLLSASYRKGFLTLAMFFLGHISADFLWYSIVSWGASRGSRCMSDKAYRAVIVICGICLAGFGVFFAVRSLTPRP